MTKHYILSLDPTAKYEWDRCALRDPITAEHPALADLVAQAVGERAGAYLVAINIEVKVLEETAIPQSKSLVESTPPDHAPEVPIRTQFPQLAPLVA
ncbi:MAG: hypothetical protein HC866_24425 [Leptolyngbyaceae cyanobacterium RU_5_1]|nr:hypothetical protein [Leptolyngbyaceae cyanobacterium RU_5_1]